MTRTLSLLLVAFAAIVALAASRDDFQSISANAVTKFDTKEGYQYVIKFEDWISATAVHAVGACGFTPNTSMHCDIVFLIAADGRIRKVLFAPNNSYEQCVSKNFRTSGIAPKPPADSWPMQIRLIDGRRPKYKGGDPPFVIFNASSDTRPDQPSKDSPDTPIQMREQQVDDYDRAIAPYVTQARASYPAAKERFLAGLPPNHIFLVWVRLYQKDDKTSEVRHADVFVTVESIKNGIVSGKINNKVQLVTNHHEGERISFPESEVMNWLILRPDGSEEGNVVGKFLDDYKPLGSR